LENLRALLRRLQNWYWGLAVVLAMTLVAFGLVRTYEERRVAADFQTQAIERIDRFEGSVDHALDRLAAVGAYVDASGNLDRTRFARLTSEDPVLQGWQQASAPDTFARFCEKATRHLGDLVGYASTFNEPDLPQLLNWISLGPQMGDKSVTEMMQGAIAQIRGQVNAPEFSNFFLGDPKLRRDTLLAAHALDDLPGLQLD